MEPARCLACGSTDLGSFPHPLYSVCGGCRSIVQTSGISEVSDYYDGLPLDSRHQIANYRRYLRTISSCMDTTAFALVDVGAGDGTFLAAATGRFRSVGGFDLSPKAQEALRNRGLLVDPCTIAGTSPKVVSCLQVIEHQRDPRGFLAGLGLGAADRLVLTAPAADGPNSLRHWKSGRWAGLSPSHHVCLYSRAGIESLLRSCGLAAVAYELVWAAGQSLPLQLWRFSLSCVKWPAKIALGRKAPLPIYSGIDSFLLIARRGA
jgi:hypothetical protein